MASVLTTDNRFDEYGRAESSTYVIGDRTLEYSVTYKPDSNLVGSITLPASAAQASVGYSYDGFERVTQKKISLSTNKNLVEDYAYYSYNQGEVTRATPLISRVTLRDGANVSAVYDYTYDLLGNITQIKKGGAVVSSYEYDSLGQLVRENDYANGNTHIYTYDKSGNIQAKHTWPYITDAPIGHLLTLVGYHEMISVYYTYGNSSWGDMLTSYNGTTISYDAIGNPKNWSNSTLDVRYMVWSGRQLTALTRDMLDHTLSFNYNADGVRIRKSNSDYVNSQLVDDIHTYVLDGSKIIKETIEHEVNSTVTGTDVLYYFYDAAGSITGFEYNGTPYYFQKNLQGDIVRILNASGQVVTEYSYNAWGKVLSVTGSLASTVGQINPFRYRGYYYDTETGFYYLQTRYYDSEVGRFINADGYVSTGQGIIGNNMFAYCGNNPVYRVDATGNFWSEISEFFQKAAHEIGQAISGLTPVYAGCGSAAVVDGPLPFGDIVAAIGVTLLTVGAIGYGIYQATQTPSKSVTKDEAEAKEKDITAPPPIIGTTYYHVTTLENAVAIIATNIMTGSKWESGYVYAWKTKPSKYAIDNSGAHMGVTISFKTNAPFIMDIGITNPIVQMYGPVVSAMPGPIVVWDVQIVG